MDSAALGFAKSAMGDLTRRLASGKAHVRGADKSKGALVVGAAGLGLAGAVALRRRQREKQAGAGSLLGAIGRRVFTGANVRRAALVGSGVAGGVMATKAVSRKRPMAPGSLNREKRRYEIDRYGSY